MKDISMINISVQQVQIFLKAVELRNFTQVANFYNYTPSMISKTIAALEDELDIRLFTRKPHELIPTQAALMLANDWRHFISSLNNSIAKARLYQNEMQSRIILGFVDSSDSVDSMLGRAVKEYTVSHTGVSITAEKHDMHRSAELLNAGMLDIILTSETEVPYLDDHNLPWEKIVNTSVAVFVPKTNTLFEKDSITFEELRNQPIISLDPMMHPTYSLWMYNLCGDYGFTPNVIATFRTVRSLKFSLKLMDAVFIGDSINKDWCDSDLKCFALPISSFTLAAWRKDPGKDLLEFKDYIKSVYPAEV